jgi:type I restriction enzyme S subunit
MMAAIKKVPAIRFNDFEEEWVGRELEEICNYVSSSISSGNAISNGNYDLYDANGKVGCTNSNIQKKDYITIIKDGSGVGRVRLLPKNTSFIGTMGAFHVKNSDIHFLYNSLFKTDFTKHITGATIPHIYFSSYRKDIYFTPILEEQSQIGNYFRELDNLIQAQEQKLKKVTNLKKAMLERMFPKDNADVPEIRFKGFTKKWGKKKLEEVVNITSALRVHKNEWTTSGVPFFRSSDVVSSYKGKENTKAYISNELYLKLSAISGPVKKGDILITGGGSIGIPYLIKSDDPLYFKDADLLWIKNVNNINGYFLYTFFLTQVFRRHIESITHIGTISHYTIEQAKCTPAAIPEPMEQQKIGEYFQSLDQLINQSQQKMEQLKHLKQALLQKMFI